MYQKLDYTKHALKKFKLDKETFRHVNYSK